VDTQWSQKLVLKTIIQSTTGEEQRQAFKITIWMCKCILHSNTCKKRWQELECSPHSKSQNPGRSTAQVSEAMFDTHQERIQMLLHRNN
jgi:hypothetical protein